MQLTKRTRRLFNVIIILATIGLIVSSIAGSLFYIFAS